MSYLSICQWSGVETEMEIIDVEAHLQASEQIAHQIRSYYDQSVSLGTQGDEAERDLQPSNARALYRDAYVCARTAVFLTDSYYGMVSGLPCIEELMATAVWYAELSGLNLGHDHLDSVMRGRRASQ